MKRRSRRAKRPTRPKDPAIKYGLREVSTADAALPDGVEPDELLRFYFTLPEPVAIPDGFGHFAFVPNGQGGNADDDPWVDLIFHQVTSTLGRTGGSYDALTQAIARDTSINPRAPRGTGNRLQGLQASYTVVEAITTATSPDPYPSPPTSPEFYLPRSDPFSRCLRATTDVVRASRHAVEVPYGLPTYPRIPSFVLFYAGEGNVAFEHRDGKRLRHIRMVTPWSEGSAMLLEHGNFPDPLLDEGSVSERAEPFRHWLRELERGNPLALSRERFIEARRSREVLGEYGQAVTLANTSAETLLDVVLALILWEEKVDVGTAAAKFEEGKTLKRLRSELAPRLGGDWATDRGPVGEWMDRAYRLRHRVVHAGYSPSPEEALDAICAVNSLQRFTMDRIAAQRTRYKRSALMTVAEQGLRQRGLWSGQIKDFAENDAPHEPSWRDDFTEFHRELVAALAP